MNILASLVLFVSYEKGSLCWIKVLDYWCADWAFFLFFGFGNLAKMLGSIQYEYRLFSQFSLIVYDCASTAPIAGIFVRSSLLICHSD